MTTEYHLFKMILEGLDLKLTGMSLYRFVQSATDCTLEQFEAVYQQIQEAWKK